MILIFVSRLFILFLTGKNFNFHASDKSKKSTFYSYWGQRDA